MGILKYLFLCAGTALPIAGIAAMLRRCGEEEGPARGQAFTRAMALKAALFALGYLAVVYLAAALYCAVTAGHVTWQGVFDAFRKSDAAHYRNLAELGYDGYIENGQHLFLVFFPLYPWAVRAVHTLLGGGWDACAHLLSAGCFVGGCVVFARLMTEDIGWPAAMRGLGLLAAWPFSFFFAGVFTESLFFLLSVSAFYLIRRRRWWSAGLLGALAVLTRMQGMLLVLPWLAQYWLDERPIRKLRRRDWRGLGTDMVRRLLPLVLLALGAGAYFALNWAVEGDPFRFAFYQRDHWAQYPVPLSKCLAVILNELIGHGNDGFAAATLGPELAVYLLAAGALIYAARALPLPWTAYFLGHLLIDYSLSWPLSCGRYMACAFPLFAALAVAREKRPAMGPFTVTAFALLQGAYLYAFLAGAPIY